MAFRGPQPNSSALQRADTTVYSTTCHGEIADVRTGSSVWPSRCSCQFTSWEHSQLSLKVAVEHDVKTRWFCHCNLWFGVDIYGTGQQRGARWIVEIVDFLRNPLTGLIHQDKNDAYFQGCRTHSWKWIWLWLQRKYEGWWWFTMASYLIAMLMLQRTYSDLRQYNEMNILKVSIFYWKCSAK